MQEKALHASSVQHEIRKRHFYTDFLSRHDNCCVFVRLLWSHYMQLLPVASQISTWKSQHRWVNQSVTVWSSALQLQTVSGSSESHCIFKRTHVGTNTCKCTTTGEALESPSSPPTPPAAPLPSLIHPHQGPECLLSLSAPHYLLSFRVPCSPLWGHLVFGVGGFFGGCEAFSIAACSVKLKRVLAGSRC